MELRSERAGDLSRVPFGGHSDSLFNKELHFYVLPQKSKSLEVE